MDWKTIARQKVQEAADKERRLSEEAKNGYEQTQEEYTPLHSRMWHILGLTNPTPEQEALIDYYYAMTEKRDALFKAKWFHAREAEAYERLLSSVLCSGEIAEAP